ncbi:MAG: branched-chain amino acid transaminase, partial [Chloroflexi bacterium]|nr:branched-chain amino acid transaminase [Chloroflexota bacterium]
MTNRTASVNGAPQPQFAFFRGEVVPLEDARVSVMTHALHYGTAVFEGIRGNWNSEHETTYIFRLREHYERLHLGCRMLMLDIPYSVDDLCNITVELVQKNANRSDVYIRPLAYKSEELVANLKLHEIASDFTLVVVPFGNYLGTENLRCCTSSWRRMEDQVHPTQIKTSANYLNSILAKTEAVLGGFDEAILLNQDGHVSEGSGENIFMMRKGQLITPILEDNPLPGITRETVMELAREELGIEVVERRIDRSELYLADEIFLS